MSEQAIGSLERAYAEAKEFATRFGSLYLIYRPVVENPDYYAVMPKGFLDRLIGLPFIKEAVDRITSTTIVFVSPAANKTSKQQKQYETRGNTAEETGPPVEEKQSDSFVSGSEVLCPLGGASQLEEAP